MVGGTRRRFRIRRSASLTGLAGQALRKPLQILDKSHTAVRIRSSPLGVGRAELLAPSRARGAPLVGAPRSNRLLYPRDHGDGLRRSTPRPRPSCRSRCRRDRGRSRSSGRSPCQRGPSSLDAARLEVGVRRIEQALGVLPRERAERAGVERAGRPAEPDRRLLAVASDLTGERRTRANSRNDDCAKRSHDQKRLAHLVPSPL